MVPPRREPTVAANPARGTVRSRRRAEKAISIPRRFLPSLSALSAFEAVARTGSVTEAARELSRTQGAISRQISSLEDQLEVRLFYRERQALRLTPAGHAYVREIRESLHRIGAASMSLRANPAGGSLSVAAPPAFAAQWLVPRLPQFLADHPDVMLNLLTRETRVSFQSESIDAAIYFTDEPWQDVEGIELQAHEVIPVCSPAVKRQYRFKSPVDLRRAPLLHLASWPDGWEQWLQHHRAPSEQVRGMLFDQVMTLAAAAAVGMGVALLPPFLFSEELKQSTLVPALPLSLTATQRYRLAWPKDRSTYPPLTAFRDWLESKLKASADEPGPELLYKLE